MKLVERNGLRILTSDFGYLIHNKETDIYAEKFYLGINANIEDFEEVEDDAIDKKLRAKVVELEEKEESLNKIGKIVANQVTDDVVALSIQEFYDIWTVGVLYPVGRYITHNDILYKVLTEHTSQTDWTPDVSPSLFAKVLIDPTGETISEWVQPDSTNAYMTGDKVEHNEQIYVSTIDNNVWEPGVYGWEIVKEE